MRLRDSELIVESLSEQAATTTIESDTHSFIVKVWLEEPIEQARGGRWRGYITHVASGERHYFTELTEIRAVIMRYSGTMPPSVEFKRGMLRWLFRTLSSVLKSGSTRTGVEMRTFEYGHHERSDKNGDSSNDSGNTANNNNKCDPHH